MYLIKAGNRWLWTAGEGITKYMLTSSSQLENNDCEKEEIFENLVLWLTERSKQKTEIAVR